jgi:hypothetical protein
MTRPSIRRSTNRPSGGERVFTDDAGRLWSAVPTADAMIFTCISEARQSSRALALEGAVRGDEIGDETLRAWLRAAPRIGTLG